MLCGASPDATSFDIAPSMHSMPACECVLMIQDSRHPAHHLQAGLGVAVQYANELGIDWIWTQVQQLAAELRSKLQSMPGVTVHDRGRSLCGIVSFNKVGLGKHAHCTATAAAHLSDA